MQVFEDYFNDFFSNARDFYFGENNRGWRADFDFLLREDVFDKALEGEFVMDKIYHLEYALIGALLKAGLTPKARGDHDVA